MQGHTHDKYKKKQVRKHKPSKPLHLRKPKPYLALKASSQLEKKIMKILIMYGLKFRKIKTRENCGETIGNSEGTRGI